MAKTRKMAIKPPTLKHVKPPRWGREPEFVEESTDQARRRALRQRREERELIAQDTLDNDADVTTIAEARKRADEVLEFRRQVEKGILDPSTGELTEKGKKLEGASRRNESAPGDPRLLRPRKATSPRRGRSRSGRADRRLTKFATSSVGMVAAPFGSVASAAWTFAMGGFSIVLLYLLLSREGTGLVATVIRAIGTGAANITNPWTPLFGSKAETSPPPSKKWVARTHKKTAKQAMALATHGTRSGRTGRYGSGVGGPQ